MKLYFCASLRTHKITVKYLLHNCFVCRKSINTICLPHRQILAFKRGQYTTHIISNFYAFCKNSKIIFQKFVQLPLRLKQEVLRVQLLYCHAWKNYAKRKTLQEGQKNNTIFTLVYLVFCCFPDVFQSCHSNPPKLPPFLSLETPLHNGHQPLCCLYTRRRIYSRNSLCSAPRLLRYTASLAPLLELMSTPRSSAPPIRTCPLEKSSLVPLSSVSI